MFRSAATLMVDLPWTALALLGGVILLTVAVLALRLFRKKIRKWNRAATDGNLAHDLPTARFNGKQDRIVGSIGLLRAAFLIFRVTKRQQ